ncbi:MAG: hypothetical protein FWG42_04965 [Clostridiales bacterium]|nr:hypothetical protein [Clostridiales bacterium]
MIIRKRLLGLTICIALALTLAFPAGGIAFSSLGTDDDTLYVSVAGSGDSYFLYIRNAKDITSVDVRITVDGEGYYLEPMNGFSEAYDLDSGIYTLMYRSGSSIGFSSVEKVVISEIVTDGAVPRLGNVAAVGIRNGMPAYVNAAVEAPDPDPEPTVDETAKLSIRTDPACYITSEAEYILSIQDAKGVLSVAMEFELDGNVLSFKRIEQLNGFGNSDSILWELADSGTWKGQTTLTYESEDSSGFTSEASVDIAKLVFVPRALGDATVKLTNVEVVGYAGDSTEYLDADIEAGEATTTVERLYSRYDLDRDGFVDALDLGIMLLYCGYDKDSLDWDTLAKVKDSHDVGVTASMCDVNGDGLIDMLDLLDLFIHYSSKAENTGDDPEVTEQFRW